MSRLVSCVVLPLVLISSPPARAQGDTPEAPRFTPEEARTELRRRAINQYWQEMARLDRAEERERKAFDDRLFRLSERAIEGDSAVAMWFLIEALNVLLRMPENRTRIAEFMPTIPPHFIVQDPYFFRDFRRLLQQFETLGDKPILWGECPPDSDLLICTHGDKLWKPAPAVGAK